MRYVDYKSYKSYKFVNCTNYNQSETLMMRPIGEANTHPEHLSIDLLCPFLLNRQVDPSVFD